MNSFFSKIHSLFLRHREIISYLIVGGLTTLVSLGVYYLCVITFLNPDNPGQLQAANIISWIAAVTFAYITNRKFVFRSKSPSIIREAISFYAARLASLGMDMGIMFLFVSLLGMNDKISKLIVQVIVTIVNYILSKFLVFRKSNNSKESDDKFE